MFEPYLLQRIVDALPSAAYTCDAGGLITHFNADAATLWGRSPRCHDPTVRFCGSLEMFDVAGAPLPHAECWSARAIQERRRHVGHEAVLARPDGSRVRVLAQASPIFEDGELVGALSLLTELPEASFFSEAVYAALFERAFAEAKDGALFTRTDGTTLRANPAACKLLGYSEAELCTLGRRVLQDHLSDEVSSVIAERESRGVARFETTFVRSDGMPLVMQVTTVLVGRGLWGSNALVIFRDLGPHREAERAQQVSQRMETIGQLAGGVAHNFNNLLVVMRAACVRIGDVVAGTDEGSVIEAELATLDSAIDECSELTKRMLAVGQRQMSKATTFGMNAALAEMLPAFRRLGREDVELVARCGDDVEAVCIDRGELEQVLLNLTLNAREAMPQGGVVTFTTRVEQVTERAEGGRGLPPGPYVVIDIDDTGGGISSRDMGRVFEPFFTTKASSYGLGLSTAYGIVQRSGGKISVRSGIGRGATFTIHLPQVPERATTAPPTKLAPASGARASANILVVEDMPIVRSSIARLLASAGHRVLEAADGVEGLAILESDEPIDLLLTDAVMPGIDGPELARRARKLRPGIRLIVMSGYATSAEIRLAVAQGARFLMKPFNHKDLLAEVSAQLDPPARELARG